MWGFRWNWLSNWEIKFYQAEFLSCPCQPCSGLSPPRHQLFPGNNNHQYWQVHNLTRSQLFSKYNDHNGHFITMTSYDFIWFNDLTLQWGRVHISRPCQKSKGQLLTGNKPGEWCHIIDSVVSHWHPQTPSSQQHGSYRVFHIRTICPAKILTFLNFLIELTEGWGEASGERVTSSEQPIPTNINRRIFKYWYHGISISI